MLNLVFLLLGFIPLVFGADILVAGASSIAKKLNIPAIVIGLTIVAFGTSAPELVVNIFASTSGNSQIVLGNVVGSNIFNVLVILGIAAIIYPLAVKNSTTWIEIPLSLIAGAVILLMANDIVIDGNQQSVISRIDGIILLVFFLIFMVYNFQLMKSGSFEESVEDKEYSLARSVLMTLGGLILLGAGGKIIVDFAVKFAQFLKVPERIIALTIVSIGTSLPELATSAVAASKKNVDIAIGNIVGSNIFNIFLILGVSATIAPVPGSFSSSIDMGVNVFAGLLLFLFVFTGKGRKIDRWEGILLIFFYLVYLAYLLGLRLPI